MPNYDEKLKEILDDLTCRFVINVPDEERAEFERIGFQIEQAHWFYEDIIRIDEPYLPTFQLKSFAEKICQNCKLLERFTNNREFDKFMAYRLSIPVRGAIILNSTLDKCVLVKGWHAKASWGFPRGKINKEEEDSECAIREVLEETGFNIRNRLHEKDHIMYKGVSRFYQNTSRNPYSSRHQEAPAKQDIKLYIITDVPEDTKFEPQTKNEIGGVEWFLLDDLQEKSTANGTSNKRDGKFFMIAPVIKDLKKFVEKKKKERKKQLAAAVIEHKEGIQVHQHHYESLAESHHGLPVNTRIPTTNDPMILLQTTQALKSLMGVGHSNNVMQNAPYPDTSQQSAPHRQYPSAANPADYMARYSNMPTGPQQNGNGHPTFNGAEQWN